jgi:SAM-dependent methyltransferase
MSLKQRYGDRYKAGDTPWDVGKPDFNLIEVVTSHPVPPGKALDVGCGTGDNTIWLAQHGFQAVGTDFTDMAIDKAREKAAEADANCEFLVVNFLEKQIAGQPFGFVFDRGLFHSFRAAGDRVAFAEHVAGHLADGGLWLSIVGNADETRDGPGPPRRTALDIVSAVEPCFEILSLRTSHFESRSLNPPRAWQCLMRKRAVRPNSEA